MRKVILVVLFLGLIYAVICAALYFFQDAMLFPGRVGSRQAEYIVPTNVKVSRLTSEAGDEYRIAIGMPNGPVRGVLVWFLGNGENLSSGVRRAEAFADYGLATLVTEYPGYGESKGSPSIKSILSAADRSAKEGFALADSLGIDPVFIGGQSLGTFCAVHLAAKGHGAKLLLVSPLTSIVEAARSRFGWLPVKALIKNPFDNVSLASEIAIPTLIIHGEVDRIAPIEMGRRLAKLIPNCVFVEQHGAGHNNLELGAGGLLCNRILDHFFN